MVSTYRIGTRQTLRRSGTEHAVRAFCRVSGGQNRGMSKGWNTLSASDNPARTGGCARCRLPSHSALTLYCLRVFESGFEAQRKPVEGLTLGEHA